MRQFRTWYNGKNKLKRLDQLSNAERQQEIFKFFDDVYPGTKDDPTKLAALMTSDDPKTAVENNAALQDDKCDSEDDSKSSDQVNNPSSNDICPSDFDFLEYNGCVHMAYIMMTYNEAQEYCNQKSSSQLLHFESYKAVEWFNNYESKGT